MLRPPPLSPLPSPSYSDDVFVVGMAVLVWFRHVCFSPGKFTYVLVQVVLVPIPNSLSNVDCVVSNAKKCVSLEYTKNKKKRKEGAIALRYRTIGCYIADFHCKDCRTWIR